MILGCREPLDFDREFTADPERGKALFMQNCANTCHPADAFAHKKVRSFEELANRTRDYYEQVLGKGAEYSQQDIFDLAKYLDKTYYHYKRDFAF
jgi:mono/diheme cytochrome c family protein